MEALANMFVVLLVVLAVVFVVTCIIQVVRGGLKKSVAPLPHQDVAKTFGHLAAQLQEEAEMQKLKNTALQTRILEIRERLLDLKEKSEQNNVTETGAKGDLRKRLYDLILDTDLWEVSDE